MEEVTIRTETLTKLIKLLPDLLVHTKFAADTYLLWCNNSVLGKACEEKHKEATKLMHDLVKVTKEIKSEIER